MKQSFFPMEMNFTEIANNITFIYLLIIIAVLLSFIAYKMSSRKRSSK